MDTQLLHAFLAVADKRSFSLAADQLNLTQSAISKRIALLEEELSSPLFDRIGRQVHLTEAGNTLLPHAKQLVEDTESTVRLMKERRGEVGGLLRIATSHHIGVHRLPPFLKVYTQQYPKVHLDIHFIDSEQATQAILRGEFDLAIITLPEASPDDRASTIQQHVLWQDPMQFVVSKDHALALHSDSISAKALNQYPAILPDPNTRTTELVKEVLAKKNIEPTVSMTTNHLDAIKMMVSVGLGWSALPESLIDNSVIPLAITGLKKTALTRQLGCIHHRHRTLSNASRTMLKTLKGHV